MNFPTVNEQESLEFLSKFIQIPSHSKHAAEIDAIKYMTTALQAIELEAQSIEFTDKTDGMLRCNSVGVWKGTGHVSGGRSLLFNGHVDVNPVTEGWTVDPYAGKYDKAETYVQNDNKFIYGIGVSNMKSGCCAYYMAVKTLKDAGWKVSKDVTLTYVVGELQGGAGTVALLEQGKITKETADCFINCEPTDVYGLVMHAGSAIFEINIIGDTRHMSKREEATDAILCSMEAIQKLTYMTFSDPRSSVHESVNRCHVGTIHGGLGRNYESWRAPQVADFVTITGAARYAPGQNEAIVLADLRRELESVQVQHPKMKFELSLVKHDFMPPFEVDPSADIVQTLNRGYKAVRGVDQPTGALKPPCFYGSDAGHLYEKLGMEGIVCGPGGKFNTMPDERVDIVDYLDCIRVFMRVIVETCGGYHE
ncbi:hypothetical protein PSN45_003863 [Yamadazyma tenuis]|uniref:Zn-dependent exopeptidase n=1 Tax=Candida tenuis (strain ATCC 10573 / BCRC 21748 / CBS 615 / JCM 9827 / NBRC 10315 / NRRL Y-1498 / VKM Y-70) TaxID=590646 RepID=G3B300_CANTC|nr:Zn-dependent exopeptidase [Yamadazyma tenuis ATCC 10573]EGV64047.1 Zn-dependent exopeptidase [Yamadazyma tenuis ATCC 10573]WEJ96326.1 hypothetical protein PSN45_003863 [Yamadazyma tenuis]